MKLKTKYYIKFLSYSLLTGIESTVRELWIRPIFLTLNS
ncbi:hypothetical protein LEP1GSC106_3326 [Leptospira interrogans serovar Grippotyphosa str. UI 12764]|nr:hypothetical protein LEP1GSC106_3326 [Leptospira interrogans serovar Grippotyphosa str. UI 12764]